MDDAPSPESTPRHGIGTLVVHPQFGQGRIVGYEGNAYMVVFKGGQSKRVAFFYNEMQVAEAEGDPELDRIKQAVREVLQDHGWLESDIEMGTRWAGGTLEMMPGRTDTQSKQVPIESFFKKIIGVRDKLRVLEQKINSSKTLAPEEKMELQGYITRCYGSLTTFNTLFACKESQFKGMGKSGEED